eukprot:m.1358634 g.1358634  ORF g.1358634 m.1358634 type:complete len:190 (-) comp24935_c0_seq10:121-690(-)
MSDKGLLGGRHTGINEFEVTALRQRHAQGVDHGHRAGAGESDDETPDVSSSGDDAEVEVAVGLLGDLSQPRGAVYKVVVSALVVLFFAVVWELLPDLTIAVQQCATTAWELGSAWTANMVDTAARASPEAASGAADDIPADPAFDNDTSATLGETDPVAALAVAANNATQAAAQITAKAIDMVNATPKE